MRTTPFNIERAKAGHTVQTRDGKPARIICYDSHHEHYPIVALITEDGEESPSMYCIDGRYDRSLKRPKDEDLVMVSENLYRPVQKDKSSTGWAVIVSESSKTVFSNMNQREADHICALLNENPLPEHEA